MSLQNYEKKRNMLAFPFGKVVENSLNYEIEDFFLLVSLGTLQAAGYSQDSRFNLKKMMCC